jgi:hypothetical protein
MENAVGRVPKKKLFEKYIEMELQLGNVNRYQIHYEKYMERSLLNCSA